MTSQIGLYVSLLPKHNWRQDCKFPLEPFRPSFRLNPSEKQSLYNSLEPLHMNQLICPPAATLGFRSHFLKTLGCS